MSFPCGLEHLRRCTGSTRWWSVDWHRCQPRYPRSVHFSWSFWLIGTYNQFFIPRNQVSHIRICSLFHFHAQLQTCLCLLQAFQYLPVASNPHTEHCLFYLSHFCLVLLVDYAVVGYNSPRTRHDLYTPTLFFVKAVYLFSRRIAYDSSLLSTVTFSPP